MSDQDQNHLDHELRQQEATETGLTGFFATLEPPYGARQRLLAKLDGVFHESQLTLNDAGPYSFADHAALTDADADVPDLLAAGLEEEPVDEDELDEEDE